VIIADLPESEPDHGRRGKEDHAGRHTEQPKDGERPRARFHMTRLHRIGNGLVAPYGAVPWVLNARAAGTVSLQRHPVFALEALPD
jgi:hypothetical protein